MNAGRMVANAMRRAVAVLAGLLAGMFAVPALAVAAPAPVQLEAADTLLMNGVRLAGLWEIPAGEMAADKGNSARVREVGAEIAKQHVQLDKLVVDAANKLGVELPAEPNADQKGWLGEMKGSSGARFDRFFVDRLRAAHGAIFPVIGAVRVNTRNPVVRELAQQAHIFVNNHMTMLESTGLVRYNDLPAVVLPDGQAGSALALPESGQAPGTGGSLIWLVVVGALGVGAVATFRVLRPGPRT